MPAGRADIVRLSAGPLALDLAPAHGAAVLGFTRDGVAVLRPVADPRLLAFGDLPVAAYPLLPFANRVGRGRFVWAGETHRLGLNFGDHPHAIHGNGFMRAWTVVEAAAERVRLRLRHAPPADPPGEWPFAYDAVLELALDARGLSLGMALRNTDRLAWPAGLGWHPFFPRDAATTLGFLAQDVWRAGADGLPAERVPVGGAFDFAAARPLGETLIDECYAGWQGDAAIGLAGQGLSLRLSAAPPLRFAQLYVPPGRDFFALEPVSHMPDAINRMDAVPDHGLVVLEPGATLRAAIRLEIG